MSARELTDEELGLLAFDRPGVYVTSAPRDRGRNMVLTFRQLAIEAGDWLMAHGFVPYRDGEYYWWVIPQGTTLDQLHQVYDALVVLHHAAGLRL